MTYTKITNQDGECGKGKTHQKCVIAPLRFVVFSFLSIKAWQCRLKTAWAVDFGADKLPGVEPLWKFSKPIHAVFFQKVHNRFQPLKMENAENVRLTQFCTDHRTQLNPCGEVNDLGVKFSIKRSVEQIAKRLTVSYNSLHA